MKKWEKALIKDMTEAFRPGAEWIPRPKHPRLKVAAVKPKEKQT
ncbi:hypothetical protein MHI18_10000 [Peribacillus sp. FSL H8-0477]